MSKHLTITVDTNKLSENGGFLLEAARRSDLHLKSILRPDADGNTAVTVWDSDELGSDDVIEIRVMSLLSTDDRARKFGLHGIERRQSTGEMGVEAPIPTKEHLANLRRMYGEWWDGHQPGHWEFPDEIVRKLKRNQLTPTQAIDMAGDQFREWLKRGEFDVSGWPYTPAEWLAGFGERYGVTSEEYVRQMCREQVGTDEHAAKLPWPWRAEKAGRSWLISC